MPSTKLLSTTQRRILEAAADRPSRVVLPLPSDLPVRGAIRQRLLAGLLQAGLTEEVLATDAAEAWRTDETGLSMALRVSVHGFAAIGRSPPAESRRTRARPASAWAKSPASADAAALPASTASAGNAPAGSEPPALADAPAEKHPGGKLGSVLATLSRHGGATLGELAALTGWQPHTTRAALTRLRQRGYALERLELDGRKAYRVSGPR
ncbi:DUF3489 domain-containing protein [Falsiroseomonas sp.]|uniref:DUF3489 domain-containing protein n=1 Tax=Falsiroseomonas sp. TaxID=2870721 RepID=UPI003567700E